VWLSKLISLSVINIVREKEVKIKQPDELKVFYHFLFLSAILYAFFMALTLVKQYVVFSQAADLGSVLKFMQPFMGIIQCP
jgi:hypothetical protein